MLKKFGFNALLFISAALLAIFVGGQLPGLINKIRGPFEAGDFKLHVAGKTNRITLYGTTTCPHCESARKYLASAGIKFNDRIIDESKEAALDFKKLEKQGVPVLVSADRLVVGFNESTYAEFIRLDNKNESR